LVASSLDQLRENVVPRKYCQLIHTSDVHLDNEIGPAGEESRGQLGFMAVVDAAIEKNVDLFLLAGDLFDHNRVKQPCLEFTVRQLSRLHCPVVMIAGNHDCLADYSIYHQFNPGIAETDVHFIQNPAGDSLEFEAWGLRIWGQGIVEHAPDNKPLANVPVVPYEGWHVGMAHGYLNTRGGDSYSSMITEEEIAGSSLDYLALGHVHVFTDMEFGGTRAVYPGSPNLSQGSKESTAAHVILDPELGISVNRLTFSIGL
jgi:exonuclease SbcD